MSKTNAEQFKIFMRAMENYPNPGKVKIYQAFWKELADALNAAGPPTYSLEGWKKVSLLMHHKSIFFKYF